MSFSSWHNAVRSNPIPQELISEGKTRCTCPENDNPGEFGENSNLPCMSFEPVCCKDCIYCEIIESKNKSSSINFGIFDLMFDSKLKDKVIEILEQNKSSVLNYIINDNEYSNETIIHIDQYDKQKIGDVLNILAKL